MHGGDVYRNHVILDYSVNVNPCGIPLGVTKAMQSGLEDLMKYPDMECMLLREKLAAWTGVEKSRILCGNGASELIHAVCQWKKPRKTLLPSPGFVGYEKPPLAVGSEILREWLLEEESFHIMERILVTLQKEKPDLLILTSPSNPVGNLLSEELFVRICEVCREIHCTVLLDECFIHLSDRGGKDSRLSYLDTFENLLILRAFTKSFAIPGIRLGYLLSPSEEVAGEILQYLPEWNVSVLAQYAGVAALQEEEYLEKSIRLIQQERGFLTTILEKAGCKVYPSAANYLLFQDPQKRDWYPRLLAHGILIRDCRETAGLTEGFYRIAVKTREENLIFEKTIKEVLPPYTKD